MKHPVFRLVLALAAGLTAGGCATMNRAAEEASLREDMLIVQENARKLSGRLEGFELELQRLGGEIEALRAESARLSPSQVQALQARVDEMDGRLRALDAAREKDRQELLDRLSSKMSEILRGHAASSSARRPAARRQASDTGYEHEVKPGETLSAIAAAYGVSVKAILDNNDVKNPDRLQVGQRLFIPD